MELKEALGKASQILEEERKFPTVRYKLTLGKPGNPLAALAGISGLQYLNSLRAQRPREILEDTGEYRFESTNYDLLCALSSQLPAPSRQTLLQAILRRVVSWPGCGKTSKVCYPIWEKLVSELPLVAEFAVRNGHAQALSQILSEAQPIPGHVLLLKQLEDMIALNLTYCLSQRAEI